MKKFFITILAACASLFGFASCTQDISGLEGTWTAKELKLEGVDYQLVPADITFVKPAASSVQVYGNAGVNSFNGKIKIQKNKIDFGKGLAMTKMMGDPVSMSFEDALTEIMNTADTYKLENNTLTIYSSKTDSFVVYNKN